jgi:hypothetical protein
MPGVRNWIAGVEDDGQRRDKRGLHAACHVGRKREQGDVSSVRGKLVA